MILLQCWVVFIYIFYFQQCCFPIWSLAFMATKFFKLFIKKLCYLKLKESDWILFLCSSKDGAYVQILLQTVQNICDLFDHTKSVHNNSTNPCQFCSKSRFFFQESTFRKHIEEDISNKFESDKCWVGISKNGGINSKTQIKLHC